MVQVQNGPGLTLIQNNIDTIFGISYRIVFLNLYSAAHGRDHSVARPVRKPRK